MLGDAGPRVCRKGTRSCTECRRRKLRCTWTVQDPNTCRRCEERGLQCAPQVFGSPSSSRLGTTTRDRVARLEDHVAELSKVVRHLSSHRDNTTSSGDVPQSASQVNDSGYELQSSENSIPARPSYMNALFNNDHISSADTATESVNSGSSFVALPKPASDRARTLLTQLIPLRQDVTVIANWSSGWLAFFNNIFPDASVCRSREEMIAQYDKVCQSTVDPAVLASWLISIALAAEHIPQTQEALGFSQSWLKNSSDYSRSVAETVETAIITPDEMVTSPSAVDAILLLTRLHLARGSSMKSFLHLRRAVAAAEVIGLPRATSGPRASTWKAVCCIERFHSTLFAFPSATRWYLKPKPDQCFVNGRVIPIEFISYLSEVAVDLGDLGDSSIASTNTDVVARISKLGDALQRLASLAPHEWWSDTDALPVPDQLMQYMYYYVKMRTYLPTFLRPSCSQSICGRSACIDACIELATRYVQLCPLLPDGFFVHRVTNLQVFPAMVILLLSDHQASLSEQPVRPRQDSQATIDLVGQVVKVMEDRMKRTRVPVVMEAVVTIKALIDLLGTRKDNKQKDSILLSVPLLGKLHVQCRANPSESLESRQAVSSNLSPGKVQPAVDDSCSQLALDKTGSEAWDVFWAIEETPELWFYEMGLPGSPDALSQTM